MDQQQLIALCGMDESVRSLVGLYCRELPAEMELEKWFSGITFDALRPEVSCLAAALASADEYSHAPAALAPRLRGIMRYVHTLNSGMMAGLCALGKRLNEAGIPTALSGGTAVHLGYPQPPRRHIWQAEIIVPEADFSRAAALAAEEGFTVQMTPYSATARNGNTQCVVIRKGGQPAPETTALTANGVPFQMPGSGDLLVNLAEAVFRLLSAAEPGAKLVPPIMDLHCVITAGPDWKRAGAAAEERNTAGQVRLVLELYNSLAPNILNKNTLDAFGAEASAAHLARLLPEYRKLKPGGSRLKRLWLSAQAKSGQTPSATLRVFLKDLFRTGKRKLTPKN